MEPQDSGTLNGGTYLTYKAVLGMGFPSGTESRGSFQVTVKQRGQPLIWLPVDFDGSPWISLVTIGPSWCGVLSWQPIRGRLLWVGIPLF